MKIIQPSFKTLLRTILLLSAILSCLSIWQSIALARRMDIDYTASTSWMGFLVGLFTLGFVSILGWTFTGSPFGKRILVFVESPERIHQNVRWLGWTALVVSLIGYTAVFAIPFVNNLFGGEYWVRIFVFYCFSMVGLIAVKFIWHHPPLFISLLTVVLVQTTFHLLIANFSQVTNYPFAMGWSETSRYYHPSFFISESIYGREYPLPILHPTLHLLLVPPYLFDAPLWVHRMWQVTLRYLFLAVTVLAMVNRISNKTDLISRLLIGLWLFLYLLVGPLYFHLTIPVILILIGYSAHNDRKTWFVLLLASAWCGWSRVNWYPVPAMIIAVLYVLETPFKGKSLFQYLWKPALWGLAGLLTAFAFQRIYIAVSGVENTNYFYTSFVSDLLWYRMFPSATFPTGILPTAIMFSFPLWLVMYIVLRRHPDSFLPIRIFLILAALTALFTVGLLVSLKIGGGADLHNMDAYFILLLIVCPNLVSGSYQREDGKPALPISLHWAVVLLLIAVPVWPQLGTNAGIGTYDPSRTDAVLTNLQERVDQINLQGGDVLFITQRHLISMGMLYDVKLVPEYEREDLMEMAMGNNMEYLGNFRDDMENQRFSLIIVDPLKFQFLGRERSFAEENNVWVRQVMKHILCNYREDTVFPEDDIALYVPQVGERHCP